jgi:hypothetical protein
MATNEVETGRYRHWKGRDYEILGIGLHTETDEEFVVYVDAEAAVGLPHYYLRPLVNFVSPAVVDGRAVPRFMPVPRQG